jgi:single-stranded-DNA-specific exonuclease
MAAGVTMRETDFARFRELFAQVADELLAAADRTRTLETDGGLEAAYFSIATARLLEAEVWGQGFPAPLFEDEFVVESQRILKDKHLKLRLRKGMQTSMPSSSTSPRHRAAASARLTGWRSTTSTACRRRS